MLSLLTTALSLPMTAHFERALQHESRVRIESLPDQKTGKTSTVLKATLSNAVFSSGSFQNAASLVLDNVLSPALSQLTIPGGSEINGGDDAPTTVEFYDSECWAVRDAHNLLRVRHFPEGSKRANDFTFKHRVDSEAGAVDANMNTTLLTADGKAQCGRHDLKRQLIVGGNKYSAYRSFRDDGNCTNNVLNLLDGGTSAKALGEAFPGLGFAAGDMTTISKHKTAMQHAAVIGGGAAKTDGCTHSKKKVCMCAGARGADGTCAGESVAVEFEVVAWYSTEGGLIAGELTWGYEGLSTVNEDSTRLLQLLVSKFGSYLGAGSKTAALYGPSKPSHCAATSSAADDADDDDADVDED